MEVLFKIASLKFFRCGQILRKFSKSSDDQLGILGCLGILYLGVSSHWGRGEDSSSPLTSELEEGPGSSSSDSSLLSKTLARLRVCFFLLPAQKVL